MNVWLPCDNLQTRVKENSKKSRNEALKPKKEGAHNELSEFLAPFKQSISQAGQEVYAENFVKGFLSDLQYKSAEPIALRYGASVRGTQRFLKDGKWDTEIMENIYRKTLSETIAGPGGMITIDECGEPKKGNNSVGVARQ